MFTAQLIEGSDENNSINRMQEYLQAICPVSGVPPYTTEERHYLGGFQVRIVLNKTGPLADEDMLMPWSSTFAKKIDCKKDAARLCLEQLLASGARPHDTTVVSKVIHQTGSGGSGRNVYEDKLVRLVPTLPELTDQLLAVDHVECKPVASGGYLNSRVKKRCDDSAMTALNSSSSSSSSSSPSVP
jgi:hypothetical protein